MVNLTLTSVITAPAGIPATGIVLDTPVVLLSVTISGKPDVAATVVVDGAEAFVSRNCWMLPVHIVAAVGVTVAISGVTVSVAGGVVKSVAVHEPVTRARYW